MNGNRLAGPRIDATKVFDYRYSCCVDETAAQHVAADCVVHFGRTCLTPNGQLPVYYILPKRPLDLDRCADLIGETFVTNEQPVLVLYDVAYHHFRGRCTSVTVCVYTTVANRSLQKRRVYYYR